MDDRRAPPLLPPQRDQNAAAGPGRGRRGLRADDAGAALVEYALLLGLIALVCIAAVTTTGTVLAARFAQVATALSLPLDGGDPGKGNPGNGNNGNSGSNGNGGGNGNGNGNGGGGNNGGGNGNGNGNGNGR